MKLDLSPQQLVAVVTGLGLLAELSMKPALVQHLSSGTRLTMVQYFENPSCMVMSDLNDLVQGIAQQAEEALKQVGL